MFFLILSYFFYLKNRLFLKDFVRSIKEKDRKIRDQSGIEDSIDDAVPPVRSVSNPPEVKNSQATCMIKSKRICSTEYEKWDKFDAGAKTN